MAAGSVNTKLQPLLDLTVRLHGARQQVMRLERELSAALRRLPEDKRERRCHLLAPDRTVWLLDWDGTSVYISKVETLDCLTEQQEEKPTPDQGANAVRLDDDPLDF